MGISSSRIVNRGKPAPAPAPPVRPAPPVARPVGKAAGVAGKAIAPETVVNGAIIKTIALATITATCGHVVSFAVNADEPKSNIIAEHKNRKCPKCTMADRRARKHAKKIASQAEKQPGQSKIREGNPGDLPIGAVITLTRVDDGGWAGECQADGLTVTTFAPGPARQVPWLAAAWVDARKREAAPDKA